MGINKLIKEKKKKVNPWKRLDEFEWMNAYVRH